MTRDITWGSDTLRTREKSNTDNHSKADTREKVVEAVKDVCEKLFGCVYDSLCLFVGY